MFSARGQFDGRCAAKCWRIVVLRSGGHADDYRFRVPADMNPVFFALARSCKAIQCRTDRYRHGARAANARASRSFGVGGECKSSGWPKELHYFGEEGESVASGFRELSERAETFLALSVARHQVDLLIAGSIRFDYAGSVARNRHVHC